MYLFNKHQAKKQFTRKKVLSFAYFGGYGYFFLLVRKSFLPKLGGHSHYFLMYLKRHSFLVLVFLYLFLLNNGGKLCVVLLLFGQFGQFDEL